MRKIERRLDRSVRLARPLVARAGVLTLPYEARCKSRQAATLDNGEEVGLVLPRGTVLSEGDVLVADDGGFIRVVAAAETLMRVTATSEARLIRAAYHLGNRHTPVEFGDGYLQLETDSVLRAMLQGIGMTVTAVDAPFQPEPGAYGGGHKHGHDATFAEDYALAQSVYAEHDHARDHGHPHDHGHAHDHRHVPDHQHGHDNSQHGHDHVHDASCGHDHGNAPVQFHRKTPNRTQGDGPRHDHDHDHGHGNGHAYSRKHDDHKH
ncbi:urease accessory protein [Robbsia andropogonis]|uniref:urease accessory protein UreE n=1 Tax=Robbsia andropogonis TaxID=28092 RepID=UPI003D1D400B